MTAPGVVSPLPEEARCAEHPEAPSIAPCSRCGRFMCADCSSPLSFGHCTACAAIAGDPHGLLAHPFSAFGALGRGFRMVAGTLRPITVLLIVQSLIGGSFSWWLAQQHMTEVQLYQVESLVDLVVWLVFELATIALFVGYAEGRPLTLGGALRRAMGAWRYALGANVHAGIVSLLYALLLVIPGVMKAMSLMLVTPIVYRELRSDPLKTSSRLTEGHRWALFGIFLLLLGFNVLVGFVQGGVDYVATDLLLYESWPWLNLTQTIALELAYRGIYVLDTAFLVAAYYGLKRSKGEALPPLVD